MIKKILGWMIFLSIYVGFVGVLVVDTMNKFQISLSSATAAVILSLLIVLGIAGLLALALYLIFG